MIPSRPCTVRKSVLRREAFPQVRQATSLLLQLAKSLGITIFIVGHVTKEGVVAGPRVLETYGGHGIVF